jgi:hypothetical protein
MTDNEIIQALEKSLQMGDAPIGAHWGVLLTTKLLSDSLDLIKRQRAEIERLKGALAMDNDVPTKWISVKERLPQNFVSVLGHMTDAGEFPPIRECYTVGNAFFFPALSDVHSVSHWMEMPEPPKGE